MRRLPSRKWAFPAACVVAAWMMVFAVGGALAEPTLEWSELDGPVSVREPFTIECTIRWSEGDGPWQVQPAEFEAPGWAAMEASKWTAYTEDGMHVLVQTISVEPFEAGGHEIPAIAFRFTRNHAFQPAETQVPQSPNAPMTLDALRVPPFPVEVKPHTTPNWVSAGLPLLLAVLAVSALGWYVVRRRRRLPLQPASGPAAPQFEDDWLADVQQKRLNGDTYGFYVRLAEQAPAPDLREQFRRTAEAVGYKGEQISPDQLDQDLRALQRSLRDGEGRNDS